MGGWNYGSERSGMVWDMGCRYHTMIWYDIEIISFDFYEMVWETCWYHEMMWEVSGICRGIPCYMQGMGNILYIEVYFYIWNSTDHSSHHSAPSSLSLSLRSAHGHRNFLSYPPLVWEMVYTMGYPCIYQKFPRSYLYKRSGVTPLDTVPWEGMGGYGMGYPTKYTRPFRPVAGTMAKAVEWLLSHNLPWNALRKAMLWLMESAWIIVSHITDYSGNWSRLLQDQSKYQEMIGDLEMYQKNCSHLGTCTGWHENLTACV